jgi:hypothetical protein
MILRNRLPERTYEARAPLSIVLLAGDIRAEASETLRQRRFMLCLANVYGQLCAIGDAPMAGLRGAFRRREVNALVQGFGLFQRPASEPGTPPDQLVRTRPFAERQFTYG